VVAGENDIAAVIGRVGDAYREDIERVWAMTSDALEGELRKSPGEKTSGKKAEKQERLLAFLINNPAVAAQRRLV